MKKPLLLALALCAASAHAPAQSPSAAPSAAEKRAPPAVKVEPAKVVTDETFAAELKDLDGASFFLSNYRGRVFVLNFWATWCGPCRLEIPQLNKLYDEFSARGVEFVGLTTERPEADAEKVRRFAREFGMRYKIGWADRDVALSLMSGTPIPQTLVVAPDGRIALRIRGYSPQVPQMLRHALEKALDPSYEPPPAKPAPAPPAPPAPRAAPETLPAPGA